MPRLRKIIILIFLLLIAVCQHDYAARRMALVDVNLSGAERFALIPGLNRKIAGNIIKYRDKSGYFERISDLMNVPGISRKIYESIEMYLTITSPAEIVSQRLYDEFGEFSDRESAGETDIDLDRIDKYRYNPLDMNTATVSQMMDLPYMTRSAAENIADYRRKKRGISSIYELRQVIPEIVYDNISPFIDVIPVREPEKLHGDVRFRYGLWPYPFSESYAEGDPVYHNPAYFYNRARLYYGNRAETGYVLRKDRNSRGLDYRNIKEYFLIKNYLLLRNVFFADTLVLGNYSLDFAQGLFIQPEPFLIRSIPRQPRGLMEDSGTHYNDNFYGAAFSKRIGLMEMFLFYSNKPLIVTHFNPDGSTGTDTSTLYDYFITYMSRDSSYENFGALNEKLTGTRLRFYIMPGLVFGAGYYEERFDPYIDPSDLDRNTGDVEYLITDYYFRGDRVKLSSIDIEYTYGKLKMFADAGRSFYHTFDRTVSGSDEYAAKEKDWYWGEGDAIQLTAVLGQGRSFFWANYHKLDPDYFAFHSSPWTMELVAEQYKRNEEGYILGGKYSAGPAITQLSLKYGTHVQMPMYVPGTTLSTRDEFEIYWDNSYRVNKKFVLKYRNTNTFKDRTATFGEPPLIGDYLKGTDSSIHIPYRVHKNRFEVEYEPDSDIRLKTRYETVDNTYRDLGISMFGYTIFGELKYKPTSSLTVYSRVTYWDAPAGVSTGAMEYTWPNSLIPFGYYSVYSASEKNYRFYVMPTLRLSRNAKLWMKYEFWPRAEASAKSIFKMQYDCSW